MDDLRAIVKPFEMLEDPVRSEQSRDACLNLSKAKLDAIVKREIQEFISDHLLPAKVENTCRPLAKRQERLQLSLELIQQKASRDDKGDDATTIPIDPRLSDSTTNWSGTGDVTLRGGTTRIAAERADYGKQQRINNTNVFHHYRAASTPANVYPSPTTSQLEQIFAWSGADAKQSAEE